MSTNELRPGFLEGALAPMSDLGNAERFTYQHQDTIRWCQPWKQWVIYNGAYWEKDVHNKIGKFAKDTVRSIYAEAADVVEEDERKILAKHGLRSESSGAINAMLERAKSELFIAPEDFNTQLHLINCKNGTVNLQTGELQDHSPHNFLTSCVDANFNPEATCPTWDAFLGSIFNHDTELIAYVQQALGMSLSGDIKERVFFICYGVGSNGKTTLLEVMRRILNDYAKQANIETFMMRKNEGISNDRAELFGARLVNASEMKIGSRMNEALIKKVTGGEPERARFLHTNEFEFSPQYTLWFAVNHLPEVKDTTKSIWDRLRYIPFNVVFLDNHPDISKRIDRDLLKKLLEEKDAIFTRLAQQCASWYQDGHLTTPQIVIDAGNSYRRDMDEIGRFLDDCCTSTTEKKHDVQAAILYEAYEKWCDKEGATPEKQTAFGRSMTERGYTKYKTTHVHYSGIKLVDISLSDTAQRNQILYGEEKVRGLDSLDSNSRFSPIYHTYEKNPEKPSKPSNPLKSFQDVPGENLAANSPNGMSEAEREELERQVSEALQDMDLRVE